MKDMLDRLFDHTKTEDIAVERSRDSITQLLDIRPEYANLVTKDGTVTKVSPTQRS